jgi:H+/Cl- antiporter ClcA
MYYQRILKLVNRLLSKLNILNNAALMRSLQQALPFWVASAITGLVAVLFAMLFDWAEHIVLWYASLSWWALFITCPLFFWLSRWLVRRYAPAARGSGIPQVMASVELATPKHNHKVSYLLGLRVLVVKIASSIALVLGGGAVGREGPTIQIAGSVFKFINDLTPAFWPKVPRKNMIITGAAAGLAAAFNTPLGGIVFAMEELAKNHFRYFRTPLFAAVIIAGLAAQGMLGPYLYLGYPNVSGSNWYIFFAIILVAGICGTAGAAMASGILRIGAWKKKLNERKQLYYLLGAALLMATLGALVSTDALGPGKEIMNDLLFTHKKQPEWYMPLVRFVGPMVSFTAGGAGGVFAPSLSAGATIGGTLAFWMGLTDANANLMILAGMVGFLTGITRSPFTSAILVLEMTDRHSVIFHLMVAALVSNLSAILVDKKSMYERLKEEYLQEAMLTDKDEAAPEGKSIGPT